MYYLEIAVPVALNQTFTYTSQELIPSGFRVKIPFGERNRKLIGVVVKGSDLRPSGDVPLKAIEERVDEEAVYSPDLMKLALWMSDYYLYPLGEVLRTMLPVSQVKRKISKYSMTEKALEARSDPHHSLGPLFLYLWKRKGSASAKLLQQKLKAWEELHGEKQSLKKLVKDGWLTHEQEQQTRLRKTWSVEDADLLPLPKGESDAPVLTGLQAGVLNSLIEEGLRGSGKGTWLLHGVTGAGKTEVYLHLIQNVLKDDPDAQILVMVPEIALTPQMTRIFSGRFPGLVSVVHSAMPVQDRWLELQRMRNGQRRILIGPRSAVFAAFKKLMLTIVDEEHDSSYKQATGLTYNGRDVAVMRGHIEGRMVLLGSATPSLESYANAQQGKYRLLELPERVAGRSLPEIRLISTDLNQGYARRLGSGARRARVVELPVDAKILEALRENHARGMQAMVLVNRRGFAYYVYSLREKKSLSCPHCSISLTVHQKSTILRCHYCDYQRSLDAVIPNSAADDYVLVGFGSEQMELYLRDALPGARIQRVDSDTVTQKDALPAILEDFRQGRIDVLVGTQMLAKGHDFAKVTLICILELDQTLNLPDFRSGERTFQLMVQAAGRAGRGEFPGQVLIQSQKIDHPVLLAGLDQDYKTFWNDQVRFRQTHQYPPFARMILIEFSGSRREQLIAWIASIERWIAQKMQGEKGREKFSHLQILGPAVPPIEMIRGRARRTLLLISAQRNELWAFARELLQTFHAPPGDVRIKADVDPQSLM